MKKEDLHRELIQKVLLNDCSTEEVKQLDELRAADTELNVYFEKMSEVHELTDGLNEFHQRLDIDGDIQIFLDRIANEEADVIPIRNSNNKLNMLLKIAAVFLITLGAWYVYHSMTSVEMIVKESFAETVESQFNDKSTITWCHRHRLIVTSPSLLIFLCASWII